MSERFGFDGVPLGRDAFDGWDDAHDLTAYEAEIVEEDQIDPPDVDGDRPLSPEELEDLYRHSPMEHRV